MSLRSVTQLEEEIAALEKEALGVKEDPEPEKEPEVKQEEKPEPQNKTEAPATDPEEKGWAKRYADLRTLQQKTAARVKELEAAQTKPAAVTEEQVKEWIKTNPKAADIIKAIAVQSTPVQDLEQIKQEIAQSKARQQISKVHPDFDDIVESDEFHKWADTQPSRIQDLIFSDKPDDVIWSLTFYKEQTAPKADAKKDAARLVKTKSGAEAPSDRSTPVYSESVVQKMSLAEYEKNEAAILASQKAGNFIYDLSGGAR